MKRHEADIIEQMIPLWRKRYSFRERTIILYVFRLCRRHLQAILRGGDS